MELCPNCYSDNVERTSSTGLRVVVCIVLLFIPFGLLICWVPFVFPHSFRCKYCSKEGKEEELLSVDWRERETFVEKEHQLRETMTPLLNKWFEQAKKLYTIREWENQFVLFEIESYINPSKIIDCELNQLRIEAGGLDIQVLDFSLTKNEYEPTKDGEILFSKEELLFLIDRNKEQFIEHLNEENRLIEPYEIVVGKERMDGMGTIGV